MLCFFRAEGAFRLTTNHYTREKTTYGILEKACASLIILLSRRDYCLESWTSTYVLDF